MSFKIDRPHSKIRFMDIVSVQIHIEVVLPVVKFAVKVFKNVYKSLQLIDLIALFIDAQIYENSL